MPLGANKAAIMGVAGVSTGDVVLLSSQTADDDATISFTSGITSTYGEYIFRFYNINNDSGNQSMLVQFNASGGSGYDETLTTTFFRPKHNEADDVTQLAYQTASDQAQGTAFQKISQASGGGADESTAGEMHLFNPSSTTYVKHFTVQTQFYSSSNSGASFEDFVAGYINTTAAITNVQFKFDSGNITVGTFKMWGVK